MENLQSHFIKLKNEFIQPVVSEKSVENLYDIIYLLEKNENRNFNETYFLAEALNLVGQNIYAEKIIENKLVENLNKTELEKLKKLKQIIKSRDIWNIKKYRDLRDAKILKEPTKLNLSDFIISKNISEYCIALSNEIKDIVVFNKNVQIEKLLFNENNNIAFSQKDPTNILILKLIEHIEWIGQTKIELLHFYNEEFFGEGKLYNVGQKWYDGLNVGDISIYIDNSENFETEIILYDYLQNDYGFRLEIENKVFKNIEYDPIL